MTNNIIQTFSDKKNIPQMIGDYSLDFIGTVEDGSLQLRYEGKENGFFTITLYNGGIDIPDNLEDPIIVTEFENCLKAIFDMEAEKCYQNINLLVNELFVFENEKEPKFLSAVFNYDRDLLNG